MTGSERYVVKCSVMLPSHLPTPKGNLQRQAFLPNSVLRSIDEWTEKGLTKDRFFSLVKSGLIVQCDEETLVQVVNARGYAPPVSISPGMETEQMEKAQGDQPLFKNDPTKVNGYDEKFLQQKSTEDLRGIVKENHPNHTNIDAMGRDQLVDIILTPAD